MNVLVQFSVRDHFPVKQELGAAGGVTRAKRALVFGELGWQEGKKGRESTAARRAGRGRAASAARSQPRNRELFLQISERFK